VLARDADTGALTPIQEIGDRTDDYLELAGVIASVVVSRDGAHVYAGSYESSVSIVVFARGADGRLSTVQRSGPLGVSGGQLAISPDGQVLYAGAFDSLGVLRRDGTSGRISVVERLVGVTTWLSSITGLAAVPDGLYVTQDRAPRLLHFRRTCGDGTVDAGESCDDGNRSDGDGCSTTCTVEACFACTGGRRAAFPLAPPRAMTATRAPATTCAQGEPVPASPLPTGRPATTATPARSTTPVTPAAARQARHARAASARSATTTRAASGASSTAAGCPLRSAPAVRCG
jgi:cysteine-rich repeat protein